MTGRERVVASIRQSLPEFFKKNGIQVGRPPIPFPDLFRKKVDRPPPPFLRPYETPYITEEALDNLALWVAGAIPMRMARYGCGAEVPGSGIACACAAICQEWYDVPRPEDIPAKETA
jgi:hypothetical protein